MTNPRAMLTWLATSRRDFLRSRWDRTHRSQGSARTVDGQAGGKVLRVPGSS